MPIEIIAFTLLGLAIGATSMALFGLSVTIATVDQHEEADAMSAKVIHWQDRYAKLAYRFAKVRHERDAMRRMLRNEMK